MWLHGLPVAGVWPRICLYSSVRFLIGKSNPDWNAARFISYNNLNQKASRIRIIQINNCNYLFVCSLLNWIEALCNYVTQGHGVLSPVLKSSMLEFQKMQHFFVRHFAPRSIVRKGVLPKNRSLLWDWTPSHAKRIYKGQNLENPLALWAITFDWSVLRTWIQRLRATFPMLFSQIPPLSTFRQVVCHICHVTCATYICGIYVTCQVVYHWKEH